MSLPTPCERKPQRSNPTAWIRVTLAPASRGALPKKRPTQSRSFRNGTAQMVEKRASPYRAPTRRQKKKRAATMGNPKFLILLAPRVGLEPMTYGLINQGCYY